MESVNNILQLLALVLQVNHIRLGKNRTPTGHIGGILALQANFDKVGQYFVNLILGYIGSYRLNGCG